MRRREFITLLGGAAAAWPFAARAQQGDRRQVTIWMGRPNDAEGLRLAVAFREAFQALGWANGRNARIEYRWVTSDIDRLSLAKEVVEQQPDVIVAETTAAVAALSHVNSTIPIVFVNVSDPIGGGFVGSLAQPGGVITGFISKEPTLGSKWPGLLKEIAPGVERLGFLFNPDTAPYAERAASRHEISPPKTISASGRERCRRTGFFTHCDGASLSLAAGAHHRRFSPRWPLRHPRAPDGSMAFGTARPTIRRREPARCSLKHRHRGSRAGTG